jgi:hypothetical protein
MSAIGIRTAHASMATLDSLYASKGRFLSHLLGLFIASEFLIAGAAGRSIPFLSFPFFTNWLDLPLRLVALWLIVDRNWRIGRLKVAPWDAIVLGFPLIVGILYPFVAMDPSIPVRFEFYRGFLGDALRFYTVYILIREGYNRPGFNGRIVVFWVLGALAFSATLSLGQALNIGSLRVWSARFYAQAGLPNPADSYRASGTAVHWNGFASQMILALILVFAPLSHRKMKWYELAVGGLFVSGLIVSTSRGGYLTLACVFIAAALFFFVSRRPRMGFTILSIACAGMVAGAAVILTMKLERFEDFLRPPKVQSQQLRSLDYRVERAHLLIQSGLDRPLTGTGPNDFLYNLHKRYMFKSASSVEGQLDVTYPLLFAQFGLWGILYIGALLGFFLSFIRRKAIMKPYSLAAFLTGVALMVHSLAEYLIGSQIMILVSIVAALALTYDRPPHVRLPDPY